MNASSTRPGADRSRGRSRLAPALLVLALMVVLAAPGCGGGGTKTPDLARGRILFTNGGSGRQACAFCHTFAAADSHGPFAPVLDVVFRPSERQHTYGTESKVRAFILHQIHVPGGCVNPNDPSHCMPADLVTGQDAVDITALILHCAGEEQNPGCRPPAPPGGPNSEAAKGQHLFNLLRCQGCHSTDGNVVLAPTMKGLYGSEVELTNGQKVTANDSYLEASIIAPDGQIVKGFKAGYMSSVIQPGTVSAPQIKALVAYIKTLANS